MQKRNLQIQSMFIVLVLVFSSISAVLLAYTSENTKTDRINLFIGKKDRSVEIALSNFKEYLPTGIEITEFNDLENQQTESSILVIAAHGNEQGISTENGLISWVDLATYIINTGINKVIAIVCDSQILEQYVPASIKVYGHSDRVDAEIGAYIGVLFVSYFLVRIVFDEKFSKLVNSYNSRIEALKHGAKANYLAEYYNVKYTNSWFGLEQYYDFKFYFTGGHAGQFFTSVTVATALMGVILAKLGAPGVISAVFLGIISIWLLYIQNDSPPGTAYFGYRVQIAPTPYVFAIVGTHGAFTLTPIGFSVDAWPLYAASIAYNTNGCWQDMLSYHRYCTDYSNLRL